MIKAIVFDWGGVLATSDSVVASEKLAKQYNCNQKQLENEIKILQEEFAATQDYEEFFSLIRKKFQIPKEELKKALLETKPNGAIDLVKALKSKGFLLYLLSNQVKFKGEHIRNNYASNLFDRIFFSYELNTKKPYKQIFELFLKETNHSPNQCLFIDDKIENINTAKSLGFNTIHFINIEQLQKQLEKFSIEI